MFINSIPDNVRQAIITLVPTSLINEISCFVFYDNHPQVRKTNDITICTSRGEVMEFHKREIVNSLLIEDCSTPQHILILRNNKCELFYLVALHDEVIVLSGSETLKIKNRISNVETYEVEDSMCIGKARIKIIRKDDAVPLILDDNFEKLGDSDIFHKESVGDSSPLLTELARKLTEARYSVKCNEKVLRDLEHLRHLAAHSCNKESSANASGAIFHDDKQGIPGALSIKSRKPWIRICNKKIVVILEVANKENDPAKHVQILLQNTKPNSLVYTTKIYEKISACPYWRETQSNSIQKDQCAAVVLVIDLKEVQYNARNQIELTSVLSYKIKAKENLLKLDKVFLSSLEIMGENFDVLNNIQKEDDTNNILCLLATSDKTDICLRLINNQEETSINLLKVLCKYLKFEEIDSNIIVHIESPYHILHGVMIEQENNIMDADNWIIHIYSRAQSQILALLHYIQDAIPYRILAKATTQAITSKVPELCRYNDSVSQSPAKFNYGGLGHSLTRQAKIILEYLDTCMMKMNESKDGRVQNKIGTEIDIFSGGPLAFKEFRRKLLEEEERGITSFCRKRSEGNVEGMIIDIDDD